MSSSIRRGNIQEEAVQLYVKKVLQSRLFIGSFKETRLVDTINSYRSVVVVSNEENELIRDLDMVRTYLKKFYGDKYWIGISKDDVAGAPSGCCLWVELFEEIFGSYWYKISKIKFRQNEMLVCLKVVRSISNDGSMSSNVSLVDNSSSNQSFPEIKFDEILPVMKVKLVNTLLALKGVLSLYNVKESLKFSLLVVVALFTGLISFFENFGDFAVRFMREVSNIIRVSTPFLLGCLDLISRVVGGLYLLVLSMWRDWKQPAYDYSQPRLTYNRNRKAIS